MMNELYIRCACIDWSRISIDSYLRGIEALNGLDRVEFSRPITFFVGENGSGKSTLLEAVAIAAGFNPEGGTRNYRFSTRDTHSQLCDALRLVRGTRRAGWGYFLRAESFYNVATQEEDYADAAHPSARFHEKSHGDGFLALTQSQLRAGGLYLFDEPEAALSPQRQLTLLLEICNCARQGAQFIIATHSPILLGAPDAQILSFDDGRIHPCAYEDTDSYQVTRMFMENRELVLKRLLECVEERD